MKKNPSISIEWRILINFQIPVSSGLALNSIHLPSFVKSHVQFSPRENRGSPVERSAATGVEVSSPKKCRKKYVSQRRHLLFTAAQISSKSLLPAGLAGGTISPPLAQLFQPAPARLHAYVTE